MPTRWHTKGEINMFKFLKRKPKPVVERNYYLARIYTRHMGIVEIYGYYASAKELAYKLSYLIDFADSFTAITKGDDTVVVIKSKDVEFIEVETEPIHKQQEETTGE